MKAKLLAAIVIAIGIVAFGLTTSANDKPSRFEKTFACMNATGLIAELIAVAPYGTGPVNRTEAWFENLFDVIGDVLSLVFNFRRGKLSRVSKSVISVDIRHTQLHFRLMTILYAEYEAVEEFMPSKLSSPATYIDELRVLKKAFVDPECRGFLG